ncbi:MAG: hypothetical protein OXI49_01120 [Acidobacteriota bacterium]|nr:hypothetical protein [Acidobacteriota bacterium]
MTIPHEESGEAPTLERLRELTRNIEAITESIREDRKSQQEDRKTQKERSEELDRRMKETDRQMKETDRRLKKAENLFTTQWGKLMESLVSGDLVRLLDGRGIGVRSLAQRTLTRRGGESYEVDIMAVNGEEIVVVEVKTTLRPEDVGRFRSKLVRFKEWWPEYRDRKVYGAMAYLQASDEVALHAERQGFFVIRATGDSASIVNAEDFETRVFA